eukprot:SAG31_NODE_3140_length_4629_cov_2.504636_1_plen_64_part_00
MAAQSLDQAQNQALRFASALRWERGARQQVEEELEKARELNKTLTAELQARRHTVANPRRRAH